MSGEMGVPGPVSTAISEAAHTGEMVRRLCERVESLADRLVGPAPKTARDDDHAVGPSVFDTIRGEARLQRGLVMSALEDLDRIEEELP